MRDRLIELLQREFYDEYDFAAIADYLIANGVIVPPCKIGDTVYYVRGENILKIVAEWIETNAYGWCVCGKYPPLSTFSFRFDDFGKTVFLTREEAEKAMERRERWMN